MLTECSQLRLLPKHAFQVAESGLVRSRSFNLDIMWEFSFGFPASQGLDHQLCDLVIPYPDIDALQLLKTATTLSNMKTVKMQTPSSIPKFWKFNCARLS
jgi:hypothetical protein